MGPALYKPGATQSMQRKVIKYSGAADVHGAARDSAP